MSEQLTRLQHLQGELHEANRALAEAALPLKQLKELNDQQRQHVADELRMRLARWESVTDEIRQLIGGTRAIARGSPSGGI